MNHIVNLQNPYNSSKNVSNSGYPRSDRSHNDPYGEVIDYSKLDKQDSKRPSKRVSFTNFVDKMARSNSIKNRNKYNLKPKNTNPMANSKNF